MTHNRLCDTQREKIDDGGGGGARAEDGVDCRGGCDGGGAEVAGCRRASEAEPAVACVVAYVQMSQCDVGIGHTLT